LKDFESALKGVKLIEKHNLNAEDLIEKFEKVLKEDETVKDEKVRVTIFEILIELNIMEKKYLVAFQLLV